MNFDTHPELIVQPYLNGVKLMKPKNDFYPFQTVGQLFSMNLAVYFVNFEATYVDANHFTRLTNFGNSQGYYSDKDFKELSFSKIFQKETIQTLISENTNVMHDKQLKIYESEKFQRLDGVIFSSLAFKLPIFNAEDKITGVFGISALTDNIVFKNTETLSSSIEQIIKTGLISPSKNILPGFHINNIYFSNQEVRCIRLLVSGKTTKAIGQQLRLSSRTIEFYLNNIKRKLTVRTKSELIEKIVSHIWPEIL